VGIATYDSSVHYYALRGPGTQPQMHVMCDVTDVFAPDGAPLLVPVGPNKAELQVGVCAKRVHQRKMSVRAQVWVAGKLITTAERVPTQGLLSVLLRGRAWRFCRPLRALVNACRHRSRYCWAEAEAVAASLCCIVLPAACPYLLANMSAGALIEQPFLIYACTLTITTSRLMLPQGFDLLCFACLVHCSIWQPRKHQSPLLSSTSVKKLDCLFQVAPFSAPLHPLAGAAGELPLPFS